MLLGVLGVLGIGMLGVLGVLGVLDTDFSYYSDTFWALFGDVRDTFHVVAGHGLETF